MVLSYCGVLGVVIVTFYNLRTHGIMSVKYMMSPKRLIPCIIKLYLCKVFLTNIIISIKNNFPIILLLCLTIITRTVIGTFYSHSLWITLQKHTFTEWGPTKPLNWIVLWCTGGYREALNCSLWCRDTPVSRTATSLMSVDFPSWKTTTKRL